MMFGKSRAASLITNDVLYQLSYTGTLPGMADGAMRTGQRAWVAGPGRLLAPVTQSV